MKKIIILNFILFLNFSITYSQCEIDNGGFENMSNWSTIVFDQDINGNNIDTLEYFSIKEWGYYDSYILINPNTNAYYYKIDTSFTIKQSSDSFSGKYAMHITSRTSPKNYFDGFPQNAVSFSQECDSLVHKIKGYYKLKSDGDDSLVLGVTAYPKNGGQSIGEGYTIVTSNANNYTQFEILFNYSNAIPQAVSIEITIGLSNNDNINAEAWIDDLTMETESLTSIEDNTQGAYNIIFFPNPTTGLFTLNMENTSGNYFFEITNINGQVAYKENINVPGNTYAAQFDLSNYTKGIYFLKIIGENNTIINRVIVRE